MTNSEPLGEVINTQNPRASSKSGNLQRAEWRNKTRDVLADHISKSNGGPKIQLTSTNLNRNSARNVG
jgi:hypothetical protein